MPSSCSFEFCRSWTVPLLSTILLVGFAGGGSMRVGAAEPPAAWKTAREEASALMASCEFAKAHQRLSEFLKTDPEFGPAYELRAWVLLDWLDLRDEFSLVDAPLRRRAMPDPASALGNVDPAVEARRVFLQDRFHDAYVAPRQFKSVQQDLEAARRLMGKDFDEHALEAFIAEFVGDLKRAKDLVAARCDSGKATPRDFLTYSRVLRAEGSFIASLKAVEMAWKSPETRAQATSRKMNLLRGLNRPADATTVFQKWQAESPHDPRLVFVRTAMTTDPTAMIADFDELVTVLPKEAGFFYGRATRFVQFRKDLDAALVDLNRAAELNPTSLIPIYARSCLYAKRGDQQAALNDATAAINCNPYFDLSLQVRARVYTKLGDEGSAKNDKRRELWLKQLYVLHFNHKQKPENIEAAFALGDHYARGEDWKPAVRALSACLQRAPRHTNALRERCRVYRTVGNLDLALADATAIVEIAPEPASYALRGDLHASRQEWNAAVEDYERAKGLDDCLEKALRQRAAWHSAAGRIAAAKTDLTRAEELATGEDVPR